MANENIEKKSRDNEKQESIQLEKCNHYKQSNTRNTKKEYIKKQDSKSRKSKVHGEFPNIQPDIERANAHVRICSEKEKQENENKKTKTYDTVSYERKITTENNAEKFEDIETKENTELKEISAISTQKEMKEEISNPKKLIVQGKLPSIQSDLEKSNAHTKISQMNSSKIKKEQNTLQDVKSDNFKKASNSNLKGKIEKSSSRLKFGQIFNTRFNLVNIKKEQNRQQFLKVMKSKLQNNEIPKPKSSFVDIGKNSKSKSLMYKQETHSKDKNNIKRALPFIPKNQVIFSTTKNWLEKSKQKYQSTLSPMALMNKKFKNPISPNSKVLETFINLKTVKNLNLCPKGQPHLSLKESTGSNIRPNQITDSSTSISPTYLDTMITKPTLTKIDILKTKQEHSDNSKAAKISEIIDELPNNKINQNITQVKNENFSLGKSNEISHQTQNSELPIYDNSREKAESKNNIDQILKEKSSIKEVKGESQIIGESLIQITEDIQGMQHVTISKNKSIETKTLTPFEKNNLEQQFEATQNTIKNKATTAEEDNKQSETKKHNIKDGIVSPKSKAPTKNFKNLGIKSYSTSMPQRLKRELYKGFGVASQMPQNTPRNSIQCYMQTLSINEDDQDYRTGLKSMDECEDFRINNFKKADVNLKDVISDNVIIIKEAKKNSTDPVESLEGITKSFLRHIRTKMMDFIRGNSKSQIKDDDISLQSQAIKKCKKIPVVRKRSQEKIRPSTTSNITKLCNQTIKLPATKLSKKKSLKRTNTAKDNTMKENEFLNTTKTKAKQDKPVTSIIQNKVSAKMKSLANTSSKTTKVKEQGSSIVSKIQKSTNTKIQDTTTPSTSRQSNTSQSFLEFDNRSVGSIFADTVATALAECGKENKLTSRYATSLDLYNADSLAEEEFRKIMLIAQDVKNKIKNTEVKIRNMERTKQLTANEEAVDHSQENVESEFQKNEEQSLEDQKNEDIEVTTNEIYKGEDQIQKLGIEELNDDETETVTIIKDNKEISLKLPKFDEETFKSQTDINKVFRDEDASNEVEGSTLPSPVSLDEALETNEPEISNSAVEEIRVPPFFLYEKNADNELEVLSTVTDDLTFTDTKQECLNYVSKNLNDYENESGQGTLGNSTDVYLTPSSSKLDLTSSPSCDGNKIQNIHIPKVKEQIWRRSQSEYFGVGDQEQDAQELLQLIQNEAKQPLVDENDIRSFCKKNDYPKSKICRENNELTNEMLDEDYQCTQETLNEDQAEVNDDESIPAIKIQKYMSDKIEHMDNEELTDDLSEITDLENANMKKLTEGLSGPLKSTPKENFTDKISTDTTNFNPMKNLVRNFILERSPVSQSEVCKYFWKNRKSNVKLTPTKYKDALQELTSEDPKSNKIFFSYENAQTMLDKKGRKSNSGKINSDKISQRKTIYHEIVRDMEIRDQNSKKLKEIDEVIDKPLYSIESANEKSSAMISIPFNLAYRAKPDKKDEIKRASIESILKDVSSLNVSSSVNLLTTKRSIPIEQFLLENFEDNFEKKKEIPDKTLDVPEEIRLDISNVQAENLNKSIKDHPSENLSMVPPENLGLVPPENLGLVENLDASGDNLPEIQKISNTSSSLTVIGKSSMTAQPPQIAIPNIRNDLPLDTSNQKINEPYDALSVPNKGKPDESEQPKRSTDVISEEDPSSTKRMILNLSPSKDFYKDITNENSKLKRELLQDPNKMIEVASKVMAENQYTKFLLDLKSTRDSTNYWLKQIIEGLTSNSAWKNLGKNPFKRSKRALQLHKEVIKKSVTPNEGLDCVKESKFKKQEKSETATKVIKKRQKHIPAKISNKDQTEDVTNVATKALMESVPQPKLKCIPENPTQPVAIHSDLKSRENKTSLELELENTKQKTGEVTPNPKKDFKILGHTINQENTSKRNLSLHRISDNIINYGSLPYTLKKYLESPSIHLELNTSTKDVYSQSYSRLETLPSCEKPNKSHKKPRNKGKVKTPNLIVKRENSISSMCSGKVSEFDDNIKPTVTKVSKLKKPKGKLTKSRVLQKKTKSEKSKGLNQKLDGNIARPNTEVSIKEEIKTEKTPDKNTLIKERKNNKIYEESESKMSIPQKTAIVLPGREPIQISITSEECLPSRVNSDSNALKDLSDVLSDCSYPVSFKRSKNYNPYYMPKRLKKNFDKKCNKSNEKLKLFNSSGSSTICSEDNIVANSSITKKNLNFQQRSFKKFENPLKKFDWKSNEKLKDLETSNVTNVQEKDPIVCQPTQVRDDLKMFGVIQTKSLAEYLKEDPELFKKMKKNKSNLMMSHNTQEAADETKKRFEYRFHDFRKREDGNAEFTSKQQVQRKKDLLEKFKCIIQSRKVASDRTRNTVPRSDSTPIMKPKMFSKILDKINYFKDTENQIDEGDTSKRSLRNKSGHSKSKLFDPSMRGKRMIHTKKEMINEDELVTWVQEHPNMEQYLRNGEVENQRVVHIPFCQNSKINQ